MSARDSGRSRVYAAEQLVRRVYDLADRSDCRTLNIHGSHITLPIERRFADTNSIQRYLDLVTNLSWVRDEWPRAAVPLRVRARAGQRAAHYERHTATIAIPPYESNQAWAMREFVVLHELAHHLAPDAAAAAHGPEFVDRCSRLVTELIGAEAGLLLRSTMHSEGVTTTLPSTETTIEPAITL